jgi:16S rRNA (cytidine1402-2'-O)-methyltransferase
MPAGVLVVVGGPLAPGDGLSARAEAAVGEGPADTTAVLARLGAGERVVVVAEPDGPEAAALVAAAIAAGHAVEHVPGPSAALAALAVSGLPTARFVVDAGLPPAGPERAARLAAVAAERRTVVVVEHVPERLARTLADLAAACGPDRRAAVVAGDVVWRGRIGDVAMPGVAARAVVVLAGAPPSAPPADAEVLAALEVELAAGASARDAARAVAARLAVPRRRAYDLAVAAVPNDKRK